MPDRDRVIYDIGRCICHVPDACRDCSKHSGDVDFDPIPCMEDLLSDALALLREQEPVKPTWRLGKPCCGSCGTVMPKWANYCPYCSRKVEWE